MPSHQSRFEFQEIPFGSRRIQHFLSINPHFVKNNGKLIHERNIEATLTIFDNFCGILHFDGGRLVYSGMNHQFIHLSHHI